MAGVASLAPVEQPASKVGDAYEGLRSEMEDARLRIQHEMVKTAMGGKLLFSPTDLSRPDLRVLDSATGDGYWLVDLAKSLAPTATLIGTDIAPQQFLQDLPHNVTLTTHSITEAWPTDYRSSFDVVHQRFVLALCPASTSADVIQKLFACVKPGGYIQLHEGDMTRIQDGPQHQAAAQFRDFLKEVWTTLGLTGNLKPGPQLVQWLKDAGAVDVKEEVIMNKTGAFAENETQNKRAISVLLALLDGMANIANCKSGIILPWRAAGLY